MNHGFEPTRLLDHDVPDTVFTGDAAAPEPPEADASPAALGPVRHLPLLLTGLRAALAPVVLWLAWSAPPLRWAFGLCLLAAFLSDIFDGVLARRLGIATPGLRRLDSLADTLFYVAATIAVWQLHPAALTGRWLTLGLLVVLEIGRYAYDVRKFGREASYHMWSSKAWGLLLFLAFFSLLARGSDGVIVDLAILWGIACDLEGLAISVVLPYWRADVPSIVHALRWRDEQ